MIHYQLQCADGHEFDGWFPGSAAFDEQAAAGLLSCPICANTSVTRAMMAPFVPKKSNAVVPARPKAVAVPQPAADGVTRLSDAPGVTRLSDAPGVTRLPDAPGVTRLPDAMRAALQRLRAEIEAHCDHVGPDFAEEARRIHYGEAPVRGIYGDATPEQAEALADEGIEIGRIPWLPRADG